MILLSADGGTALSRSNGSRFKSFRTSRNRSDNSTTLSTTTTSSSRLGGGHRRSFERLRDDHQHQHYLQPKPQPQEQTKKPMTSASSSNTKSGQEEQQQEEVDLVFSSSDSCSSASASLFPSNTLNQAKSAALWMPSAFRRVSSTLVSPTTKRSSSMPAKPTMRRTTSTVKPPHVRSSTSTVTAKTESIISLSSGPTNTKNKTSSKSESSATTAKASGTHTPLASPSKLPSKKESAEKKKKTILEDVNKTKRQKKKEEKMDKKKLKQKQNQRTKLQHLSKSKDMDAAEQELMGILEKFQQEQRQASLDTNMTKKDAGQGQRGPDETRDDNDEYADLGRNDEEDDILVITRRQKQQLRSVSPPTILPASDSRPSTRPRSFWRRAGWSFGSNASTVISSASTSKQNNSSGAYSYQLANHDDEDDENDNNNNTGWRYGRAPSHQLQSTNRYINMKNNEDDEASSGILVQSANSKSKKTSNNVVNKDKTKNAKPRNEATAKKLQSMQEQKKHLFPNQIYIDRSSSYRSGRRSQDNDDSTLSTGDTLTNDETDTSTLTSSFGRASSSVTMTTMEHQMRELGLEQASRAILLEPPSWKWFDAFVEVACQVGNNKQGTKKLTNKVVDEACQEEHTIEFFATATKDKEEVEKNNDDDADDGLPSMPSSVSSFDSQIGCFH